jgi:stage II sporulation protein AA (anti-sigma F factor antagonist)
LEINAEQVGSSLVIRLNGELDMHTAPSFRRIADAGLKPPAVKHLVVVLSEVPFMDSSGIGALLGRYRIVREKRGKLVLVGMNTAVRRVLEMAGVLEIVEVADTERRALARL